MKCYAVFELIGGYGRDIDSLVCVFLDRKKAEKFVNDKEEYYKNPPKISADEYLNENFEGYDTEDVKYAQEWYERAYLDVFGYDIREVELCQ